MNNELKLISDMLWACRNGVGWIVYLSENTTEAFVLWASVDCGQGEEVRLRKLGP